LSGRMKKRLNGSLATTKLIRSYMRKKIFWKRNSARQKHKRLFSVTPRKRRKRKKNLLDFILIFKEKASEREKKGGGGEEEGKGRGVGGVI